MKSVTTSRKAKAAMVKVERMSTRTAVIDTSPQLDIARASTCGLAHLERTRNCPARLC